MKLEVAISELPKRYRDVIRSGRAPTSDTEGAHSYRAQASTPWRYFALSAATGLTDIVVASLTTLFTLGVIALFSSELFRISCGDWSQLLRSGDTVLVFLVLVTALLFITGDVYARHWHRWRNTESRKRGLGHYGLYLSEEHLLLRRTERGGSAFLVARSQIERIERIDMRTSTEHSSMHAWQTEVHVKHGQTLMVIALPESEFEAGERLEEALLDWLASEPNPSAASKSRTR